MKNITTIIIKLLTLPITAIKWALYTILTCIFLFATDTIIDRYIGWHPVVKPLRDSTLTITLGIFKKITPPLQKIAQNFETQQQKTPNQKPQNPKSKPNTKNQPTTTPQLKKQNTKTTHTLQKTLQNLTKQLKKQHPTPHTLYTLLTLHTLLLIITTYLLYQTLHK